MTWPKGTAKAIARSLDIYYRDAARTRRMDTLNAAFIRPGDLAFDIGAHVGDRTASFRRLGARVVAVEPQPAVFRALRLLHGRDPQVQLHPVAMGATAGVTEFFVNSANPTTSTAAPDLIAAAPKAEAWADQRWDHRIKTPVMTLDQMITTHGHPDFVKIDVEGFEAEVLRGLSHPVRALSFEFTTLQRDVAIAALARLSALGLYVCNYSLGEAHCLQYETWVPPKNMAQTMASINATANSGDIYAKLTPEPT